MYTPNNHTIGIIREFCLVHITSSGTLDDGPAIFDKYILLLGKNLTICDIVLLGKN